MLIAGCTSWQNNSCQSAAKTHIIEIKNMKFMPGQIEVEAGDSIRWINKDVVAHNVAGEASDAWASPNLKTGESFITKVSTAGSYTCTLHPVMKGVISLTDK